jgi:hypothetical protein
MNFFFFLQSPLSRNSQVRSFMINLNAGENQFTMVIKVFLILILSCVVSACCDYIKQTVNGYDFYFVRHNNKYYYNLDNSTIVITYRRVKLSYRGNIVIIN